MFTGEIDYVAVECGRPDRTLVDGDGRDVAPVGVLRFTGDVSQQALGRQIAAQVRVITDPARPWRLDGRALEPSDVFVLTRNEREARAAGASLRAAGVPHAFYRQDGLFQTDEARDVRALLAAIDDPNDRARRLAAWLTPFFGLTLAAIERARDLPASHPLVARLHAWKALADEREFDRLFESLVSETAIQRREIFFATGERALTNYLHLLEVLLEQARDGHPTLAELVRGLSQLIDKTRAPLDVLEGNVQRIESERRAVQVMTMHKAKGLEAPVVFLAGGFGPPPTDQVRVYHEGRRRLAWVGTPSPAVERIVKAEEAEEDERLIYVALTRAMGRLVLPCAVEGEAVPGGKRRAGDPRPIRGPYDRVNRRVVERVTAGDPLFAVEDVGPPQHVAPDVAPHAASAWTPPAALLRDDDAGARYSRLRERCAGPVATSYTRLRAEGGGRRAAWSGSGSERAPREADPVDETQPVLLRGARASGVFLHEVLERVPVTSFAAAGGLDAWRARPDVTALLDEAIATHGVDPAQRGHAEEMVWSAYTSPLVLPGGERLEGFARALRVVREMEFVYPVARGAELVVAYVRGSVDLAFDHGGLTYFVDWKSDSLASYAPDSLGRHVAAHYEDQAMLYTLAVVKLLGVRSAEEHASRFGGLLYCFLRGFDGSRGLWSARPDWKQVQAWDEALRARRSWRGGGAS